MGILLHSPLGIMIMAPLSMRRIDLSSYCCCLTATIACFCSPTMLRWGDCRGGGKTESEPSPFFFPPLAIASSNLCCMWIAFGVQAIDQYSRESPVIWFSRVLLRPSRHIQPLRLFLPHFYLDKIKKNHSQAHYAVRVRRITSWYSANKAQTSFNQWNNTAFNVLWWAHTNLEGLRDHLLWVLF